ncbi:4419_t:CDS:2, partial [Dentiscutata heterogama]
HQTILSDALLIEKAKMLANELGVPEDKLQFSPGWLQKFKERNGIRQRKLHGEAESVDLNIITRSLPLLKDLCARLTLRCVDVHFLPANTTSMMQPMDAGIIMAFKKAYRRYQLRTNDSSLNELISALNNTHHLPNSMEVDEFLTISEENFVYEVSPDDQIIKEFAYTFKRDESIETIDDEDIEVIDDEKDDSVEIAIISSSSVLSNLESVRTFLLQQEGSNEQLKLVNSLEKFIRVKMLKSAQQTCINDYFK